MTDHETGNGRPSRKRRRLIIESSDEEPEPESKSPADVPCDRPAVMAEGITADELISLLSTMRGRDASKTIPNHNNVIPEFDPNNKMQSIQRWLNKVNECAAIYGWDERQTIHFSLQKLTGLAKKWYESLATVNYTWEAWQLKLVKAFPSDENYGKLLEEMLGRLSRPGEPLRDYFYEKLTLVSRCEIDGSKAVDCIIHGITDVTIRNGAQALRCKEPEELLGYLASQQTLSHGRRDYRSSYPFSRNTNSSSAVSGAAMTCFNCHEKGHAYTKCPKPITKCRSCNRVGHDLETCSRKKLFSRETNNNAGLERKTLKIVTCVEQLETVPEEGPTENVMINKESTVPRSNNKFFKKVVVDGVALEAYVDFGSDCSIMKISEAMKLGLTGSTEELPIIKGFGNSTIKPRFKSVVDTKIDEVEARLEVLVVDDEYLHIPMLIGQNFTELPSVTVLKSNENLFFYFSPIQANNKTSQFDDTIKLYVHRYTKVERGGLVEVYAENSYTGDVYSEGNTRLGPNQEYHLHQGCYKLVNGRGFVFVTALANFPIEFNAKTLIARVKPAVETDILPSTISANRTNSCRIQPLDRTAIKVGQQVDSSTFDRLYELLQKYRTCFATNLSELGCTTEAEMTIELHDKRPVIYRPYRMSYHEREKVREIVDELVKNDVVQESQSNYASPVLLVKKKTGEQRLCIDYRALNNKTIKDKYPLPLIEDQITNLSGNTFFITLDLASGYYQIPVASESRPLTAFVTPDGHYEFKRMPFGLANAPAVFQKMINKILGSRRFSSALAYMDDLLIPSRSIEQGFERLEEVLELLQDAGLTLKLSKCSFFDTKIEYLGYEISADGVKPSVHKIASVSDFPTPRNVHEVRQFLGLASYFRKFVQGFGVIARPLTTLLKKETNWQWTDTEETAFLKLKQRLVERPLLALYDPLLDTELHTDASSLGLGGILMQWQNSPRVLKPVAYFSRQTTAEEKHMHSYELETLAVVCSLKKFRVYLLGSKFTVFTDCNALRTTLTKKDLIPRIARWWLQISEFDFEIEYRPGCRMAHVDALSRNPPERTTVVQKDHCTKTSAVFNITSQNWLYTLQLADPELERITKILKPETDEQVKDVKKHFSVKDHILYRKVGDHLRLVVPKNARWQICKMNHDDIGHFGFSKTLDKIESQYWFPKLRRFVKKYVSACLDCAFNKDNACKARSGYLYPIEKKSIPFHTLHIDHLGPFVKSKSGKMYILTIVDGFTKYVFARPVKDTKTSNVIKVLENIFFDFGTPSRIVSDRGTAFTSSQFKSFCSRHGVKHILNAVACPRANGQAERFNQTILTALSTQNFNQDERDWDKQLGKIQWGINNTINATTKKCPSELLFGCRLNGSTENKLSDVVHHPIDDTINDLHSKVREEASSNIMITQEKQKLNYDQNRAPAVSYKVGDLVKITKVNFNNDGKSKKLMQKFIGPFKITKLLGNDRYQISDPPGFSKKRPYDSVVAADRMRPWIHLKALEVNGSSTESESSGKDSDGD